MICTPISAVFDPLDRASALQWISPLTSQPIVELFARIPLYVLNAGAEDRAVARRAFASDLPAPLLARKTKGLQNRFYNLSVRNNYDFFRTTLLEGVLVKERLLDHVKVRELLDRSNNERSSEMVDVMAFHFNLEVWLRTWQRTTQFGARRAA
jgi:asparagine synthase (glutamine-hydrolysing)